MNALEIAKEIVTLANKKYDQNRTNPLTNLEDAAELKGFLVRYPESLSIAVLSFTEYYPETLSVRKVHSFHASLSNRGEWSIVE